MTELIVNYVESNRTTLPMAAIYERALEQFPEKDVQVIFALYYSTELDYQKVQYELKEKRKYQHYLREGVFDKYNNACVISGCSRKLCLEAAHIKPVCECEPHEKYDINNVILLWMDLHKYFDAYQMSINPNTFRVEVKATCDDYEWLKPFIGKYVKLDNANKKYLMWNYERYLKE